MKDYIEKVCYLSNSQAVVKSDDMTTGILKDALQGLQWLHEKNRGGDALSDGSIGDDFRHLYGVFSKFFFSVLSISFQLHMR